MKKTFVMICLTAVMATLTACNTTKDSTAQSTTIDGEWRITEVSGKAIKQEAGENEAFIGLDTKGKKMYGCAGCNRIFGGFDIDIKKKTISFGNMGATRMMCHDMTTEDLVLSAINDVTNYETGTDGTLTLKSADGKKTIKLTKKTGK